MPDTVQIFSTVDPQEATLAQSVATFFGGYCYRISHRLYHLNFVILSKEPLTQLEAMEELLKYARQNGAGVSQEQLRFVE